MYILGLRILKILNIKKSFTQMCPPHMPILDRSLNTFSIGSLQSDLESTKMAYQIGKPAAALPYSVYYLDETSE